MKEKIFNKDFPNNLKIARRRVNSEQNIKEIDELINSVTKVKNTTNNYLKDYLLNAIYIGNK